MILKEKQINKRIKKTISWKTHRYDESTNRNFEVKNVNLKEKIVFIQSFE